MAPPDVDSVVQLAAAVSEAPHWNREAYSSMFSPSPVQHFAWLAVGEGSLGGFAITRWLPPNEPAELETVVVDACFRRQGIGRALVQACMLAATRAGATCVRLEVRESNLAALALYQRHGFFSVGRRRAYYSAPVEDAILLQAQLGSPGWQSPL